MKLLSLSTAVLAGLAVPSVLAAADTLDLTTRSETGTVNSILSGTEDQLTCNACGSLLLALKTLATLGDDAFDSALVGVCELLGLEDDDVCQGVIDLEGPIVAYVLRQMIIGTRASTVLCAGVTGLCDWPSVAPYNLGLTRKPNKKAPAPSGKTPLKVVHISDIHVDRQYETGSNYNCTKPICCRPYTTADEPGNTQYPAGEYGNTMCDTPPPLEESMYAAINALVPDHAFTIFTGDVVAHDVWSVTEAEVTDDLTQAFADMAASKIGNVYSVVGNHDSCPPNAFPYANTKSGVNVEWVYNNMSADWAQWIGSSGAAEVNSNFGSYSVIPATGLRLISLNTNFWYTLNFWNYETPQENDPSGVLQWLINELSAAEKAGQRAWIMGHMPPGSSDSFRDQSQYLDEIFQRYSATIAGLFYGHTHKDEFEIGYSDWSNQNANTATLMAYITPALTPMSGNPSFRVYDVDPVTFAVLDFTVYAADMTAPTYQTGPTWKALYSAKETYGPYTNPPLTDPKAEMTPAFWHNVTVLFEQNNTAFNQFYNLQYRDLFAESCDSDCKTQEICKLRATNANYNCASSPFSKRKRDTTTGNTFDEPHCEDDGAASILYKIAQQPGAFLDALAQAAGQSFMNTEVPANYSTSSFE